MNHTFHLTDQQRHAYHEGRLKLLVEPVERIDLHWVYPTLRNDGSWDWWHDYESERWFNRKPPYFPGDTLTDGVIHWHCPLGCEKPQPFEMDGKMYCGRCSVLGKTTECIRCTPDVCDDGDITLTVGDVRPVQGGDVTNEDAYAAGFPNNWGLQSAAELNLWLKATYPSLDVSLAWLWRIEVR